MALYKHKKDREIEQNRDMLYSLFMNKEKEGDDFIFIKSNNKLVKLEMNEIYFIEALKDYVVINTNDTRYTIHSTMKDIEVKLGTEDFIRVHRSFIVRLDKITSIDFPNLQLGNDRKLIPIGGSYREELTNRIKTL
jgi:DNA-binding LytR/AlgR family response regulator